MKKVVLVSASPKSGERSVSREFLLMAANHLANEDFSQTFIDVSQSISGPALTEAFETLTGANAIIISFPLYYFCLPGMLTRFLVDYHCYLQAKGLSLNSVRIYALVNCGFSEPDINLEAVRVIESFCRHIQATFRFGILIGGGPMMYAAAKAPFMKKQIQNLEHAFSAIQADIRSENPARIEHYSIGLNSRFSRFLYYFIGSRGWITSAQKNGLTKKDLYKKPYWAN